MSKQMTDRERSESPAAVPPPDPGEDVLDVDAQLVDQLLERADREGVDLLGLMGCCRR